SKRKEDFLFNMYRMGKNAIEKGSRDNWTIHPKRIEAAKAAIEAAQAAAAAQTTSTAPGTLAIPAAAAPPATAVTSALQGTPAAGTPPATADTTARDGRGASGGRGDRAGRGNAAEGSPAGPENTTGRGDTTGRGNTVGRGNTAGRGNAGGRGGAPIEIYTNVLHDPKWRDPRGFIVPSDQPDFLTATKFVNTLIKAGAVVHRATRPFTVSGKPYPAGSYVVKAAQPFRAHVMDMFEPQDHPDDIPYPGGPPRAPYDVTGYNIAYSMGIKFDRILDALPDDPFEKIPDLVTPAPGNVAQAPGGGGYLLSHQVNDAFIAVNRLLKANEEVYWVKQPFSANGKRYPGGTMFIPSKASTASIVQKAAADKGLSFDAVPARPAGDA